MDFAEGRRCSASVANVRVLGLVAAMHRSGFGTVEALRILAARWRSFPTPDDLHRSELRQEITSTLADFERAGLLDESRDLDIQTIQSDWPFPMHALDLSEIPVEQSELVEAQQEHGILVDAYEYGEY